MRWLIPVVLLIALAASACSKNTNMQFCEGISLEGDGMNCGTEFESGELTAIIKSEEPFGQEKVDIEIYAAGGNAKEKIDTLHAQVKSTDKTVSITLPLYTEGKYHVRAVAREKAIAEGDITITDY